MKLIILVACVVACSYAAWVNEMENPGLFEGDIVLTPKQKKLGYALKVNSQWPGGKIPYTFDGSIDSRTRSAIESGINILKGSTCLDLFPRRSERAYIQFFKGGGCYSHVGYNGGQMRVSIGQGCYYPHIVIHEILHAAGIYHEQSRQDRDKYLRINWQNIKQGMDSNFQISRDTDSLGFEYDYNSIMHYAGTAFSKDNRSPTMERIDGGVIRNNKALSSIDIQQINKLYARQCTGGGGPRTPYPPRTAYPKKTNFPPPPGGCKDLMGSACPGWKSSCSHPVIRQQCKRTCNAC